MWKNIAESDRPQGDDVILRRNYAVCVPVNKGKNTDTHTHTHTHIYIYRHTDNI